MDREWTVNGEFVFCDKVMVARCADEATAKRIAYLHNVNIRAISQTIEYLWFNDDLPQHMESAL